MRLEDLNLADRQQTELPGVREHEEGYPVTLARSPSTGSLCVCATNEGGNGRTYVDLWDLVECLRMGPPDHRLRAGFLLPKAEARDGQDHRGG